MGQAKDFFVSLREDEQYATLSVDMQTFDYIKSNFEDEEHYKLHGIKQINKAHQEDETLCELYKKNSKLKKEITKREHYLNYKE